MNRPEWPWWMGKKQAACLIGGLILGCCSYAGKRADSTIVEGRYLDREGYGRGDKLYELMVGGLDDEELPVSIVVGERQYTRQEAHRAYEEIMDRLPQWIKGDNPSTDEVRSDLNLMTWLDAYGVRLRWDTEDAQIIDSFGGVHNDSMGIDGKEEKRIVELTVSLSDGTYTESRKIPVTVLPRIYQAKDRTLLRFQELVRQADESQSCAERLELPGQMDGRALSYREPADYGSAMLFFLGAAASVLVTAKERRDKDLRQKNKSRQMLLDYSEIISKLMIFLGAGMTIRTAWERIAGDYEAMVETRRQKPRFAYEEICETWRQIRDGAPEGQAFREFGRRCGLQPYMKLSSLLEQNRKNGSKNLTNLLQLEMADAFEQRKNLAKRMGEEAGTKLLLPLFLMLGVVMVMIIVPALMQFG